MTIETKGDALYAIAKEREKGRWQSKEEVNEAWLRWFVYGDIEERENCDLYERVWNADTYKEKFPTAFALSLVHHIAKCDVCHKSYFDNMKIYNAEEEE